MPYALTLGSRDLVVGGTLDLIQVPPDNTLSASDALELLASAAPDAAPVSVLRQVLSEEVPGLDLSRLRDRDLPAQLARAVEGGWVRLVSSAPAPQKQGAGGGGVKPKPPKEEPPPKRPPPGTVKKLGRIDLTVVAVDGTIKAALGGIAVKLAGTASRDGTSADRTGMAVFASLDPGNYTVALELTPEQARDYKAPATLVGASVGGGQVVPLTIEVIKKHLSVISVDDHFAPGRETLDIRYRIRGLSDDPVKLRIHSANADADPIFERELTAAEKADGERTLTWDGKASCGGSLADHYIHPLFSPYRAEVVHDDARKGEKEFKVLYQSLTLRRGPWTPDEAEPGDQKALAQYRLNELGYWGGPVGNDTEDYLKKAVIRYKAGHKDLRETLYDSYNDSITPALEAALAKKENARPFLAGDAISNASAEARVWVEALTYEVLRTNAKGAEVDEFNDARPPKEQARLNRPLIPLEVDIALKGKADSAVLSPEGVGPVRVNWRMADADEDISRQFTSTAASPSKSRAYVDKCLKLQGGRAGDGDNAHKDYGGIREGAGTYYATPFLDGALYVPYTVQKDAGQKVVYTTACVDRAKYPKRLGKAGILFRPSYIAGDDYRITAEIDFTGLGNQAVLEGFHGVTDVKSRIHVASGTFRVWRFNRVALNVQWPARRNSNDWPGIAAEFEKAFVKVDTSGIATCSITDVLTEDEYRTIVVANTAHKDPAKIHLYADAVVGVDLPKQGRTMSAADYKTALGTFVNDDYWDKIVYPLRRQLSRNIRKTYPSGFVIIDFLTHRPVKIRKWLGTRTAEENYIAWTFSIGLPDSTVFADQKDPDKVYYVVAHEMGHNFWLHHWENAGGKKDAEHDQDDHNCVMAYSSSSSGYAHQRPGVYTPHFCGKCNLKLRGWDADSGVLPADSK